MNDADTGEDESIASSRALSSTLPIGSTLKTTANVNLRSGPSTAYAVKEVVSAGTQVTTVNRTTPSGAFYNVTVDGLTGWIHGGYLTFVSSPVIDPVVDAGSGDPTGDCGTQSSTYVCSADGSSRSRCVDGAVDTETCAQGCLREAAGTDAQCLGGSYTLSCTGSYGTQKSTSGNYDLTAFGCWTDASGGVHTDSGDNCIPTCLSQARSAGVCASGASGPACEESVSWYTADAARFGCLAHLKITNPANGKSVVAIALDYGPSCTVERSVSTPVLDASGRVDRYLFGSDQGAVDRAAVHVVEVDATTPLGPVE